MSFKTKTDPFGIADGTTIVALDVTGGESATNTEAAGEDGSIVANTVSSTLRNPSVTMALKAAISKTLGQWKIGNVTTENSKCFALGTIEITTGAGVAPGMSVSGNQVQDGAATGCYYPVPAFTLLAKHHAQILFSAFTLSGTGCHLITANYRISGKINLVTKDHEPIAFDVVEGKIEASITVKQTGSAAPELAAGTGFAITSPLAESNPDGDYPTYTATLTLYLEKSDASSQSNASSQSDASSPS
jgi:hypothetical protein